MGLDLALFLTNLRQSCRTSEPSCLDMCGIDKRLVPRTLKERDKTKPLLRILCV